MSPNRFLKPGIRAMLACALFISLPALAQTSTQATERVLDRTDLLPHLETIRRQYPRLYDRLRRETPPEQLQQAMAASAHPDLSIQRNAQAGVTSTQSRAVQPRAVSVETLLRQEVRSRATTPQTPKAVGGAQ